MDNAFIPGFSTVKEFYCMQRRTLKLIQLYNLKILHSKPAQMSNKFKQECAAGKARMILCLQLMYESFARIFPG